MECARHRVLIILIAFSLVSFPSSSRHLPHHSSRVPRPRIVFSLLFVLSPSAPICCPTQPPDRPLGLPTLIFTPRPHFVDFACSSSTRSPDLPDLASPIPHNSHPTPSDSPPRLPTLSPLHISLSLPKTHSYCSGDLSARMDTGREYPISYLRFPRPLPSKHPA